MSDRDIADIFRMNDFILGMGYEVTYGDGYFMIALREWYFQSNILSECQLQALKHSGATGWDVLRWSQTLEKTVREFRKWGI